MLKNYCDKNDELALYQKEINEQYNIIKKANEKIANIKEKLINKISKGALIGKWIKFTIKEENYYVLIAEAFLNKNDIIRIISRRLVHRSNTEINIREKDIFELNINNIEIINPNEIDFLIKTYIFEIC